MATHGETRHLGFRTHDGKISSVATIGVMESVGETYCGHCGKWVETNGVLGPLTFMAKHRDGDCVAAPAGDPDCICIRCEKSHHECSC